MSAQGLNERLRTEPFEPIRLRLSNGDTHEIRNPDLVAVMVTRLFLAFDDDRFVLIPLDHIASIESLRAA
jgi:hypothetical protein